MASRWGFEALAVELARNNPYDAAFIEWEDRIYQSGWRRDYWLSAVKRSNDAERVMLEMLRSQEELTLWEGRSFTWGWETAEEVNWEVVKERYNRHYASAFERGVN